MQVKFDEHSNHYTHSAKRRVLANQIRKANAYRRFTRVHATNIASHRNLQIIGTDATVRGRKGQEYNQESVTS